jgi:hypothetical protein
MAKTDSTCVETSLRKPSFPCSMVTYRENLEFQGPRGAGRALHRFEGSAVRPSRYTGRIIHRDLGNPGPTRPGFHCRKAPERRSGNSGAFRLETQPDHRTETIRTPALERGRFLELTGSSYRTRHLAKERQARKPTRGARISGKPAPENPEPTRGRRNRFTDLGVMKATRKNSKTIWTEEETQFLLAEARHLKASLKRSLRPKDFKRIRIPKRTFLAIKNKARRLKLYLPTHYKKRWSSREEQVLAVLARKRGLSARGIKRRGFFRSPGSSAQSWNERSIDAISQKKKRLGYVDWERSHRAKCAKRLSKEEKRQLRKALRENSHLKSTATFAREYGVAPSTIRYYRKRWRIEYSWHVAMAIPESVKRRKQIAESTRIRSLLMWKERKKKMLEGFLKQKKKMLARSSRGGKSVTLRTCTKCETEWPATKLFFAPSPKRREGRVIATYLRRGCRVCHRVVGTGTTGTR